MRAMLRWSSREGCVAWNLWCTRLACSAAAAGDRTRGSRVVAMLARLGFQRQRLHGSVLFTRTFWSLDLKASAAVPRLHWKCRQRAIVLGDFPLIMGIVNVTPDSFSDGGQFLETERAVAQALALAEQGADILDIGGESTRPGATPVPLEVELQRVIPVLKALRSQTDRLLSIDTMKAEVARQAIIAGVDIINDVSALTFDPDMLSVCAQSDCGVIAMHMRGNPQTMQQDPHYENVVREVRDYLTRRIDDFERAGGRREQLVLDPGIGFGKTAQHNVELLAHIAELRDLGRPVLIGHSRKRFLSKVLGRPVEERSAGSLGVAIAVASLGADIIRVHEVRETRDALLAWHTIVNGRVLDD